MFEVIHGRKAVFYRMVEEFHEEVANRRTLGETEWDTLEWIVQTSRQRGLKASEAAMIVYMTYRLRND